MYVHHDWSTQLLRVQVRNISHQSHRMSLIWSVSTLFFFFLFLSPHFFPFSPSSPFSLFWTSQNCRTLVTLTMWTVTSMHHQYRLSILQWNPGPARGNPTQIIAATCGRFHAVILQEASDHVPHISDQFHCVRWQHGPRQPAPIRTPSSLTLRSSPPTRPRPARKRGAR